MDPMKLSTAAQFESLALRKFLNSSLKNASPRIKNGPTLVVATFHYLWYQLLLARVVRCQ
jgi:hypothetical protein